MPQFDETTREKIVLLRGLRALGTSVEVSELVKIEWPEPDGTIYYSTLPVDEITDPPPPVSPIVNRLIPDSTPDRFLPVGLDSAIGDEEVELNFWDADGAISDLMLEHEEGVRVTLYYWFPQVELLLQLWQGHLRAEDEGEVDTLTLKAVQGFRSAEASCPSRGHTSYCQAVFGGVLTTQEEIDEYGCDYNLHLPGGTIGTLDPSTGLPWTFCPRRDRNDCVVRGVNPLRHLSHATMVRTIVNAQSSGARLLSTSIGNETNLSEPVRVVMGDRRLHDMKLMAYRRDINNNDPDRGWFQGLYDGPEGPIASISQAQITVGGVPQNAVPIHYGARLGNFGDAPADANLTPHGYSATAYIRYAFGWVDPSAVDPEDASASAFIRGLRDIRVYGAVAEGQNGLLGTYFDDYNFTTEFGDRVDPVINFPFSQNLPPLEGMQQTDWSVRWVGKIKPRYTETYTFKITHDDGVKLWVDNTVIIDSLEVNGTHEGSIALVADQLYDIRIDFKQGVSIWYLIVKWYSASQAEEVVPTERLFIADDGDALVVRMPTRNRVWHIGRMLTDKRWGNGQDYAQFGIDSWIEAADWVEDHVRFTDINGTNWDHQRGMSDTELVERKIQQQVEDMCIAGRLSLPFLFDGQLHIMPLRALTEDELDACPVFTDEGDAPNIIKEGGPGEERSTLTFRRKTKLDELPNRIECTYDSAADDYKKTPLQPVEDIDAQLAAGRVIGDKSKKVNPKKYHLLGVTSEAQAMKLAWSLLDLGPLDRGGLQNNLELTFKIWFVDALDLHAFKVIKVVSSRITKYGFTYFRVMKMERAGDLQYQLTVQAYNETFMNTFETDLSVATTKPQPPGPKPPQCILQFGDVTYDGVILDIPILSCIAVGADIDGGAVDTLFMDGIDGGASNTAHIHGIDGGGA